MNKSAAFFFWIRNLRIEISWSMPLFTDSGKSEEGKVNILQDVVLVQGSELPENIVDFLTEFHVELPLSPLPGEPVMVTTPRPGCSRMEDVRSTTPSFETSSTSKDAEKGSKRANKREAANGSDNEFAAPQSTKKRVSAAKSKQVEPKVKPKQSELRKYMKIWDETNPYRQPPMTSTLWRAPSTLDTTVSKSETVNTKNQPPTASQMPSTALNIEPTTTTTSSETTTGPHNLPKAGSIVPQPPMPTTMISSETTTGTHNLPKAGSIVPQPQMPTSMTSLETTTGPHNLPKAGSIVPQPSMPTTMISLETTTGPHNLPRAGSILSPPPMPVPTVQRTTSVPPSGSKMDLPTPQRSYNLVNDVLELGRICRERKTKLLVIRDSDERLAEIATRKRRFVDRQEQLVERKSCLLAELSEVETNIERGSQDIVGVNEEYRVEGDSTKQYRLEVAHISNCVKDLQKRIKKGVDDMVT
ncbi:uncharacterized protein isoform X2 [Leptinotarsa decemlineata]|uniref:uncharacterized protein isoform X2 n=1 Tax=Leptinotarsa decemlineata TaxID=7539 RepID=UPI003D308C21